MFRAKPYSALMLAISGLLLIAIGIYFVVIRPSLLLEDLRYIDTTLENIKANLPGLLNWLQKVFLVMGGYIFTTGLLIIFIAFTSFRKRESGAFGIVVVAGISSIGSMTAVNFIIGSDFKWILLTFIVPWAIALILYRLRK